MFPRSTSPRTPAALGSWPLLGCERSMADTLPTTRERLHRRSVSARGTFLLHSLLGVMRPALSRTRRPPREKLPRRCDGTRVPSRQPNGGLAPPRTGRLSAPAFGDFGPGPRFGIRHSPAVPHEQDRRGTPYSPVRPSQRTTLLRHARRRSGAKASWMSTTNGLSSRRRLLPRQVLDPNAPSRQRRAKYRHSSRWRG